MAIKKLQIKLEHLFFHGLYEYVIEMEIDEPAH